MKKIGYYIVMLLLAQRYVYAQQPMTVSPQLIINSSTSGVSGLQFTNLNSTSSTTTTPTKVLSVDASGNVILGNAAGSGGTTLWSVNTTTNRIEAHIGYPAGIEISRFTSQINTSLANPLINTLAGASTFLRYGRAMSTSAIFQESTTGYSRAGSSIFWKYSDESNPQVISNLFGFTGSTNTFSINGFTQLGEEATTTTSGVTSSSPAIKYRLLTGTLNGSSVTPTSSFAHGLNWTKIIAVSVIVEGRQGNTSTVLQYSSPTYEGTQNTTSNAYGFSHYFDATNIYVERVAGTTAPASALLSRPVRILITYTN